MTCEKVREELLACWGATAELSAGAIEHIESCEDCRREALLLRETHGALQSLPADRLPAGFTDRVLAEIAAEDESPGWARRIAAWLIPSDQPEWARAAAVAALALAVAGGTVWYSQSHHAAQAPAIAVTNTASGTQMAATAGEIEELMRKHQALEMTQPLADDAGVSLVMYTSY